MTQKEGEGLKMASGAFQVTDKCGCHGDSDNEAMIWGVRQADGCESHTERNNRDALFKYHLIFITHTSTRALAARLQLHSPFFFFYPLILSHFPGLRHFPS